MNSKNLLRLTDDIEDPVQELRRALSHTVRAAGRAIGVAIENSPVRGVARSLLRPQLRVTDNENEVIVTAHLPGVDLESVVVTLGPTNVLCVKTPFRPFRPSLPSRRRGRGSRSEQPSPSESHVGIRTDWRERRLVLRASIARDKATAVLENGELTVRMPKRQEAEANVPAIATRAA
jgi:HSP20 family molecular chaperone IbpA